MSTISLAHVDALLFDVEFVWLTVIQAENEPPLYRLSLRRANRVKTFVAASLEDLLAAASGNQATKACSRCGQTKPVTEYPRAPVRPDRPEGRHSHCKLCDRARKRGKYPRSQATATDAEPVAEGA